MVSFSMYPIAYITQSTNFLMVSEHAQVTVSVSLWLVSVADVMIKKLINASLLPSARNTRTAVRGCPI